MNDAPGKGQNKLLKTVLPLLVLAAGYGFYQYMVNNPPIIEQQPVEAHYPTVEVITAQPQTVTLAVQSQGTVRPRSEMTLKPEVAGRVTWISEKLVNGGVFDAGDKLLELDATDYQTELATSKTAQLRAEAEFNHASQEYRRIRALQKKNLASRAQVDDIGRRLKLAEAQRQEADIRLKQAQTNIERTTLLAPFTGRVRSENVDLGQFLSRGEAIATLYASDYYEVHLPIGIEQFVYLDIPPGTRGVLPEDRTLPVTITGNIGDAAYHWPGRLERTEGEIDAKTRLVYGVVRVANVHADGLVPLLVGMFVKASIQGRSLDNIVTLPRSALRDDNQVLVIDDNSRLRYRTVEVLRLQGDEVLIKSGLNAGEVVCVTPLQVVVDGMRVNTAPAS